MTPYYEHAGITIYHGDCREILPTFAPGSVDLVLTDPPYGVCFRNNAWDGQIPDWLPLALPLGRVAFITGTLTMWDYPRPDWVLSWVRPASNSRSRVGGFSHWSPVLLYGDFAFPVDVLSLHAIQNAYPPGFEHPTPKPERLMRWLVKYGSERDGLILDPFMGSGTTLVAAKQLGRRAIGIEIEEKYCEIAAKRLAQEVLPLEPVNWQDDNREAMSLFK